MEFATRSMLSFSLAVLAFVGGCSMFQNEVNPPASKGLGRASSEKIQRTQFLSSEDNPVSREGETSENGLTRVVKKMTGSSPDQHRAQELMQEAETEFRRAVVSPAEERQKVFDVAAKKYAQAANLWPNSTLAEDALFYSAEAMFFADRYPKASKAYDELVKAYPQTRHIDKIAARQFALAEYWLQMDHENHDWPVTPNLTDRQRPRFDTRGHALKVFDRIRLDDPTGKLSDDATMAAANAYFTAGDYHHADTLYADLRESFTDSEHQFKAHLLGLKCKLMIYEGPDYDGRVLDDAEKLVGQMMRQFPRESANEREYLRRAMAEIRLKKAEREWRMAKYFDRRKEYGAARYYYGLVRGNYSDTNLGKEAADRLAQIGDLPDVPAQQMEWLTKLFPTPERQKPLLARQPVADQRR